AADQIDGAAAGGGHQPGAGVVGHAVGRPAFQCGDQGVLGEFLGDADVPDDPGHPGDQPAELQAEDGVDGAGGLAGPGSAGAGGGLRCHSPPSDTPGATGPSGTAAADAADSALFDLPDLAGHRPVRLVDLQEPLGPLDGLGRVLGL